MTALIAVLIVVLLSLLVTRIATIALSLTGLSRESARFQARSAFSGVGFTTTEAESVVNHPVRRRVVLLLMLLGSAGLVTAIASLAISFEGATTDERLRRGLALVVGLAVLLLLARSDWVDRRLSRAIGAILRARGLDVRDYASLLHLTGDYAVSELNVKPGDWIADESLGRLRLRDEGIVVLGIERPDGEYVAVPRSSTTLRPGDQLVLYGKRERIASLDERPKGPEGDAEHERHVGERQRERRHEEHAPTDSPDEGVSRPGDHQADPEPK